MIDHSCTCYHCSLDESAPCQGGGCNRGGISKCICSPSSTPNASHKGVCIQQAEWSQHGAQPSSRLRRGFVANAELSTCTSHKQQQLCILKVQTSQCRTLPTMCHAVLPRQAGTTEALAGKHQELTDKARVRQERKAKARAPCCSVILSHNLLKNLTMHLCDD